MLPFPSILLEQEEPINKIWIDLHLASPHTTLNITEEDIWDGSFVRDVSTSADGEFTIGAAVTGQLTFILDNTEGKYDGYNFRDSTLEAYLGGTYGDEDDPTTVKIRVGTYIVDNYSYDGTNITITCFDYMCKFDKDYEPNQFTFPMQLGTFVEQCCTRCGVMSVNGGSFPNSDFEIQKAPRTTSLMYHDLISYAAQIAGCFAKADVNGRLVFGWYNGDFTRIDSYGFDGGFFDNKSPNRYMTGDTLYGGSYARSYINYTDDNGVARQRYADGDTADGGVFGDRNYSHILNNIYSLNVSTDDVMITGTKVVVTGEVTVTQGDMEDVREQTESVTYPASGNQGYIVEITGNELVQLGQTANVAERIGRIINGMKFRPLQANVLENPSIEAGDTAIISDENGAMYYAFISHVTYRNNSSTTVVCDAKNQNQNLKNYLSNEDRIKAYINSRYDMTVTSRDLAVAEMTQRISDAPGLYVYTEVDSQTGATIYYFVNQKPIAGAANRRAALANSNIQWRLASEVFSVSTDYGNNFNAAISATGDAILNRIYAIGIDASHITTGDITIGGRDGTKNVNGHIYIKDASGNTLMTLDSSGIHFFNDGVRQMTDISHNAITTEWLNTKNITAKDISASYISGKHIYLGGSGNANGVLEVQDSNGNVYGTINKDALSVGYEYGEHVEISPNGGFKVKYGDMTDMSFSLKNTSYVSSNGRTYTYHEAVIDSIDGFIFRVNGYDCLRTYMEGGTYDSSGNLVTPEPTNDLEVCGELYVSRTLQAQDIRYSGNFGYGSDRRIKKDIEPISTELAEKLIFESQPIQFRMKEGDGRIRFGFIAQEIQEIISTDDYAVVSLAKNGIRDVDKDDEDTYIRTIDYTQFIAPLVKVAQEQEKRIDAMEKEVESLKQEVMEWLSSHGED